MKPCSKCQPVCWVLSKTTGRPGVLQRCRGFNPGGAMQEYSSCPTFPPLLLSQLGPLLTEVSASFKTISSHQVGFFPCPCLSKQEEDSPGQQCRRCSITALNMLSSLFSFNIYILPGSLHSVLFLTSCHL